ncbi:MAG: ThiF family adenylyltransferase, partial [Planctomycetes bacterium]|nr:ThiF family adenylyltransferase [Planctomycetota bacterium]
FTVSIVGCGGTGGFVAEGLCRLLPPQASMVLIDMDRVEERNLGRQNFTREDLGLFKSEALAQRLARGYGRPVGYTVLPVGMLEIGQSGLVIGCVDNGLARADIAKGVCRHPYNMMWWVDAGNAENYGQVIIGNRDMQNLNGAFFEMEACLALPLPTIQRPELLVQAPRGRDCAEIAAEQGPTINQAMAALVVEVVRRLIEGTCPWMQLYLDLEAGTLSPVLATPEAVTRVTRISRRKLVRERR